MTKTIKELYQAGVKLINFPVGTIWRVNKEDRILIENDKNYCVFSNKFSIWVIPIKDNWWQEGWRINKKTGNVSLVKKEIEGKF